jgi:hypothetical protein
MATGTAGLIRYMYQALTAPARARYSGGVNKAWETMANGPWKISANFVMAGWAAALMKIASLKKSPNSMGWMVMKPITTDGMASSTSGTVTTQGDSCGLLSWP